jgi:enoyl-CoA hydratase/carnithine racemase
MRFASRERALLGLPEVGVGILPGRGAIERLAALVRPALEIIATSDDHDATTAELYGWVNRAVADNQLDGVRGSICQTSGLVRRPLAGSLLGVHDE